MSPANGNPRRRPAGDSAMTLSLAESFQNLDLSLRRSSTFHSPPSHTSDLYNPFLKAYSPLTSSERSATCPKTLEDLLIGAGERRAVDLLARVDEAIATRSQLSSILSDPEVLPVPRFMIENATLDDTKTIKQESLSEETQHQHASDSGLGSSLADSEINQGIATVTMGSSAVTKSVSSESTNTERPGLSAFAQKQIHKFIIDPILKEESLKDFHPLIKDVPARIGSKEISNLRDLEKTLIFLAPIRRYAAILAATREKQAKGEELTELDVQPGEKLELHGGSGTMTEKAELVRKRENGESYISLADDRKLSAEELTSSSPKRAMGHSFADDDAARRSMARRKKNEPVRTYTCKSAGCRKQFKRPCDLTKHVKTHERPWKCPTKGCKYHDYGWPTEKECERHVNDKHSDAPSQYKCLYDGCPYTSKRESNCKQHMEKSHGWEYVRSKNNGKGKAPAIRLPGSSSSPSYDSAMGTPLTAAFGSPSMGSTSNASGSRQESLIPYGQLATGNGFASPSQIPLFNFNGYFDDHFNMSYLNTGMTAPMTPAWSDEHRVSADASINDYSSKSPMPQMGDSMTVKPEQMERSLFGEVNFQQPTPASSYHHYSGPPSASMPIATYPGFNDTTDLTSISPAGHDLTLTSPQQFDNMQIDDTFGDTFTSDEDFQLFNLGATSSEPLFEEQFGLENMGSQFTYGSQSSESIMDLFPELKE